MISGLKNFAKTSKRISGSLCDTRLLAARQLTEAVLTEKGEATTEELKIAAKALTPAKHGLIGFFKKDQLAKRQGEMEAIATTKILEHVGLGKLGPSVPKPLEHDVQDAHLPS
jgi:hypothetical protein